MLRIIFLVIVDADDACHQANFNFQGSGTRNYDIKITQYDCDAKNLGGPPGCLQYFTGTSGDFASFNFDTTATSIPVSGAENMCSLLMI